MVSTLSAEKEPFCNEPTNENIAQFASSAQSTQPYFIATNCNNDLSMANESNCKNVDVLMYDDSCDAPNLDVMRVHSNSVGSSNLTDYARFKVKSVDDNNNPDFTQMKHIYSDEMVNLINTENVADCSTTIGELFPSLPDVVLRKLCLLRENTTSIEQLSEQEIDSRYQTLSLAFQTDKFTLEQRVRLFRHQREVIESDARNELDNLTDYVQELNRLLFSYDSKLFHQNNLLQLRQLKDMVDRIRWQCEVIRSAVMKISSKSELYGAVRQEEKLSMAFDIIRLHMDNLKRSKQRDEKEMEEMRRLLAQPNSNQDHQNPIELLRQTSCGDDDGSTCSLLNRTALKSISKTVGNPKINRIRVRRASVASVDLGSKVIKRRSFESDEPPITTTMTTTTTTFENWPNGPRTTTSTTSITSPIESDSTTNNEQQSTIRDQLLCRRRTVPTFEMKKSYRPNSLFQYLDRTTPQMDEEECEEDREDTENVDTDENSYEPDQISKLFSNESNDEKEHESDNSEIGACDNKEQLLETAEKQDWLMYLNEKLSQFNFDSLNRSIDIMKKNITGWTNRFIYFITKSKQIFKEAIQLKPDRYDQIRYFASALLILISIVIIFDSIVVPLLI